MYKIYTRLGENDSWSVVIDVAASSRKAVKVERIFMNEKEVNAFKTTALKNTAEENIMVEEMVDG